MNSTPRHKAKSWYWKFHLTNIYLNKIAAVFHLMWESSIYKIVINEFTTHHNMQHLIVLLNPSPNTQVMYTADHILNLLYHIVASFDALDSSTAEIKKWLHPKLTVLAFCYLYIVFCKTFLICRVSNHANLTTTTTKTLRNTSQ